MCTITDSLAHKYGQIEKIGRKTVFVQCTIVHAEPSYVLLEEMKARLKKTGASDPGLESDLGLKRNALKGMLDKDARTPGVDNAKKIAEALGLEVYIGPPRETGPTYNVSRASADYAAIRRVKRLDRVPDRLIILTSDNPAHPAETRQGDDMNRLRILGEIVWSAHAWSPRTARKQGPGSGRRHGPPETRLSQPVKPLFNRVCAICPDRRHDCLCRLIFCLYGPFLRITQTSRPFSGTQSQQQQTPIYKAHPCISGIGADRPASL